MEFTSDKMINYLSNKLNEIYIARSKNMTDDFINGLRTEFSANVRMIEEITGREVICKGCKCEWAD